MTRDRDLDDTVGHNIWRLRANTRTSRKTIYEALKASSSTLSKLEGGDQTATDDQLKIISEACGVSFAPAWYRQKHPLDGTSLSDSLPAAESTIAIAKDNFLLSFLEGQEKLLRSGDIASLNVGRFLGVHYKATSLSISLRHVLPPQHGAFRITDLTMLKGSSGQHSFEYGKQKYSEGRAEIYFRGALFASNDRLFLIGYDAVNFLDWVFLVLCPISDETFVGLETVTSSDFFGARRLVLQKDDENRPRPKLLDDWLSGQGQSGWVVGELAKLREMSAKLRNVSSEI